MRKDLQLKLAASQKKTGEGESGAESEGAASEASLDEEEKILEEMEGVRSKAAARAKKERKKRKESKNKARIRAAQLALSKPGATPALSLHLHVAGTFRGACSRMGRAVPAVLTTQHAPLRGADCGVSSCL